MSLKSLVIILTYNEETTIETVIKETKEIKEIKDIKEIKENLRNE